jgi:hypothetical protein
MIRYFSEPTLLVLETTPEGNISEGKSLLPLLLMVGGILLMAGMHI